MEFRLLGDIEVRAEGRRLDIGHARQRVVLVALLVDVNGAVTLDQLAERVWGGEPPQRARATLHSYLSRLRKALAPAGDTVELARRGGGYVLAADAGSVDLHRFTELAGRARGADDRTAVTLLEEALGLWRGEAFAGEDVPWLNATRATLANARRAAELDLTDRKLRLGRHAELLTELSERASAHPLDERVAGQYILALHRSGRRADALAHYGVVRRALVEELGVDPSPELAAVQQRVLLADDEADAGAGAGAGAEAGSRTSVRTESVHTETAHVTAVSAETVNVGTVHVETVQFGGGPSSPTGAAYPLPVADVRPAQLPSGVGDFAGRASLVAELRERVASTPSVVAVAGIGGVGKTTLALHVAHAVREHFPDGQLYADLHGASSAVAEPEEVLAAFIRALGVPEPAIPEGAEERAALYRSLLAERRVLVVLDNARDAAQVRPLLPGADGCTTLTTSRARPTDLAGAHLVDLDVMSEEEAMALFSGVVGEARVRDEQEVAAEVVAACGFLPLAIRIAGSRLAARRGWSVRVLASKLADERRRLDELRVGDQGVVATFELGYGQLEDEQARAFRLLGVVDGPDLSLAGAAALSDLTVDEAEDVLESLVDTSMVESLTPGRYRFHDLVRLFARGKAGPEEGARASARLLDFYLATARHVHALERPGETLVDHLEPTEHEGIRFVDQGAAIDWLFAESECVLACAGQLATGETLRPAVDLLMAVNALAESGIGGRRYVQTVESMVTAAREADDAYAEARARSSLTGLYLMAGRFDEADEEARLAGERAVVAGDPVVTAYALNDRGIAANYQGLHQDAVRYLTEALEAVRSYGNPVSEASTLCNLSRAHGDLGRVEAAVSLAEQALAVHDRVGPSLRRGTTLYALGIALTVAGRLTEAEERLTEALGILGTSRQRVWEGMTQFRLGNVHLAAGRYARAVECAESALAILRDIGGPWRRAKTLTLMGHGLKGLGERERARECWRAALELFSGMGAREAESVALLLPNG